MFTTLHALSQSATLMIVIAAEGDDLRVSITPTQTGDKTKAHKLQPLSLIASPAELDEGFAAAIASWQAPKLTLQQQVEAANAGGAGADAASTGNKPASKETPARRAGPGRPRKTEAAGSTGESTAGADADHQDGAAPVAGAADTKEPEEITLPPSGNAAITAAVDTVTLDLF